MGNGVVAIVSGLLAHTLVEGLGLGPVAPFDAAHAVLLLGGVLVAATWTENYGKGGGEGRAASLLGQIWAALRAIQKGHDVPPPHAMLQPAQPPEMKWEHVC